MLDGKLKSRLYNGEKLFGAWITVGHPDVPEILKQLPFDWIGFDTEHSPLTSESVARMFQALGETNQPPVVRLALSDPVMVKWALDIGGHGIIVPLVGTAEDARRVVSYAKYPPEGVRGVGPRRASGYLSRLAEYVKTANDNVLIVVQIETAEAVKNIEQILEVEGIDVAFVGPSDLSMSLGHFPNWTEPDVLAAMDKVVKSCKTHNKVPGTLAQSPKDVSLLVNRGFRFVALGSDIRYLIDGAKSYLTQTGKP